MEQTYVIGNYRCRSKEEYDAINSDYKKISLIKKKYDCNNPEDAKKVLGFFEEHPNIFSSALGKKFIEHLKNIVAKVKRTDREYDISQYYIPLDIPVYTPKNKLYAIIISCLVALLPIVIFHDIPYFSPHPDQTTYLWSKAMFVFMPLTIWMFILGCSEFSRIDTIGKEVARVKKELEKEQNGSSKDSIGEFLLSLVLIIILVALMLAFPPLVLILMFVKACMSAAPKLKWLCANGKYFFYGMLFHGYFLTMAALAISDETQMMLCTLEEYMPYPSILISMIYFAITYIIFRFLIKNTYQGIRTICAIPIMILMILLPFALVGLAAYAMYSDDSSATSTPSEVAPVGVHEVQGHLRHLSNGTVVYVRPHLRTNPDGILSNNFSYNG